MKRMAPEGDKKCPQYYKIGDKVEAVKLNIGAWFSADIIDIFPKPNCECYGECQCLFKLLFESDSDKPEIVERKLDEIRQVTYSSLDWDSLKRGMKVVINYNIKNPDQWGDWYDFVIKELFRRGEITYAQGTLLVGYNGVTDKIPLEINSDNVSDVLEIRPHATVYEKEMETYETGVKPEYCKTCKNKPKAKCRKCCCCKCGIKKDFNLTVLCDECADWYHIYCLNPPLTAIPDDDDWYCPKCNNETRRVKKELSLKSKLEKKRKNIRKNIRKHKEEKMEVKEKNENKIGIEKPQPDFKSKGAMKLLSPDLKHLSAKRMRSEIPKNSVIWNDVEKLFPRYEVIQITVELADKSDNEDTILSPTLERLIYADEINEHLWNQAKESIKQGKEAFLNHVRKLFTCSICCDLMKEPITLSCKHSFCITCFFKALSVNVYNCALCRIDVIHTEHYLVNENLTRALDLLFQNGKEWEDYGLAVIPCETNLKAQCYRPDQFGDLNHQKKQVH